MANKPSTEHTTFVQVSGSQPFSTHDCFLHNKFELPGHDCGKVSFRGECSRRLLSWGLPHLDFYFGKAFGLEALDMMLLWEVRVTQLLPWARQAETRFFLFFKKIRKKITTSLSPSSLILLWSLRAAACFPLQWMLHSFPWLRSSHNYNSFLSAHEPPLMQGHKGVRAVKVPKLVSTSSITSLTLISPSEVLIAALCSSFSFLLHRDRNAAQTLQVQVAFYREIRNIGCFLHF